MSRPYPPPEDREEFLRDVEQFMHQRGVPFDRNARASGREVDLYALYKRVLEYGGYDKLSGERMAWRGLVKEYNLPVQHEPAMTFQLKTVYYKNLAAYEISRAWGEEPPPREILEDLTAKGGDLRSRRVEDYTPNSKMAGADSVSNDGEEDGGQTPSRDGPIEDPGSASRYPTRQLRHNPSRTQMYQPDPTPSRSRPNFPRATSSPPPLPPPVQAYSHAAVDPRNANFTLDKYEPRQPIALTLRPVTTPGSNPDIFYQRKAMEKAQAMTRLQPDPHQIDQLRHSLQPHTLQGPSIYTRCHLGLLSGIKEEVDFALFHLLKVSDERGDKFTFSGFPGLAEGLIMKALEITSLVHGFIWEVSYDQSEGASFPFTLNGCHGTPGLREMILALPDHEDPFDVDGRQFSDPFERIIEALMIIRNMTQLEANALFISKFKIFKDFLIIALNLPSQPRLIEFKQYALDCALETTRYWQLELDDPLYHSLLSEVDSSDRGRSCTALKAIFTIGADTDAVFKVTRVPKQTIQTLIARVLLDDDELAEASLKFIYVWSTSEENITELLKEDPEVLINIVPQVASKILHNAIAHEEKIQNRPFQQKTYLPPTIPRIPKDLFNQLLQYPEPERSSRWLRCCFQESPEDDITQIAIWQAYSTMFEHSRPIAAADFIKNVSTTFTQAQAQVIQGPQSRFIIKGIKPRRILVDAHGRPYYKCYWEEVLRSSDPPQFFYGPNRQQYHICGQWASNRQGLWYHIMIEHLKVPHDGKGKLLQPEAPQKPMVNGQEDTNKDEMKVDDEVKTNGESASDSAQVTTNGKVDVPTYKCLWPTCTRKMPIKGTVNIGNHIKMHLPENAEAMAKLINEAAIIPVPGQIRPASEKDDDMYTRHKFYYTATDERGHPCGIPYIAVLILSSLARYIGRYGKNINVPSYLVNHNPSSTPGQDKTIAEKETEKRQELMARIFSVSVRHDLFHMISVHRTLAFQLVDLMNLINGGEADRSKKRVVDEAEDGIDGNPEQYVEV